jgi:choline dehydrogenase
MELVGSGYDWDYPVEPQPTGNDFVRMSRARVLGGCSSHNTGIAFWPPREDLDEWASLGCAGWAAEDCLQLLDDSPIEVRTPPPDDPCARDLLAAASSIGMPTVSFNNGETAVDSAGWLQLSVASDDTRISTSRAYLHPLIGRRPNLDIRTEAWCKRVLLSDDLRARGVEVQLPGRLAPAQILASREVIVCCGAIDTPKLLMLSGIGPPEHLREHGIAVAVASPGVGANLQDHIECVVQWQSLRPLPRRSPQDWPVALFASLSEGGSRPELMLHYGSVPYDVHTLRRGYPTTDNGFSLTPNVCRPHSSGTVRLRSRDFRDRPRVDPQYLSDPEGHDQAVLLGGVRLARRLVAQPAMDAWRGLELTPGAEVATDVELAAYVRETHGSVFHPAGTARMGGAGDSGTVLDERLNLRGTRGLRVADASAMPFVPAVNPCLTVVLMAEKCARMVAEDAGMSQTAKERYAGAA